MTEFIQNIDEKIDDKIDFLENLKLDENCNFVDTIFIFQDLLYENNITNNNKIDEYNLINKYSEKIKNLKKYKNFTQESIFILLYSSIMLYNDLCNPTITKKLSLKQFIKMLYKCNSNENFPVELLTDIYTKIYNKIKALNIENNKLESITKQNKKTCIIL